MKLYRHVVIFSTQMMQIPSKKTRFSDSIHLWEAFWLSSSKYFTDNDHFWVWPSAEKNIRVLFLYIEEEMYDISIFHYIFFSFWPQPSAFFRGTQFSVAFHQLVICNGLCPDKTFFKIRVDLACSLWSECSPPDRPGSGLIFSCCKEWDKIE